MQTNNVMLDYSGSKYQKYNENYREVDVKEELHEPQPKSIQVIFFKSKEDHALFRSEMSKLNLEAGLIFDNDEQVVLNYHYLQEKQINLASFRQIVWRNRKKWNYHYIDAQELIFPQNRSSRAHHSRFKKYLRNRMRKEFLKFKPEQIKLLCKKHSIKTAERLIEILLTKKILIYCDKFGALINETNIIKFFGKQFVRIVHRWIGQHCSGCYNSRWKSIIYKKE